MKDYKKYIPYRKYLNQIKIKLGGKIQMKDMVDEFLEKEENTLLQSKEIVLIKTNYNDVLDFIYEPKGDKFQINVNLDFKAIFNNETKELFTDDLRLEKSVFFENTFNQTNLNMKKDLEILIDMYAKENENYLKETSKYIFNKYYEDEKNLVYLENILNKTNNTQNVTFINVDLFYFNFKDFLERNKLVYEESFLRYIQNPEEEIKFLRDVYLEKCVNDLEINGVTHSLKGREVLGFKLLAREKLEQLKQQKYENKYDASILEESKSFFSKKIKNA